MKDKFQQRLTNLHIILDKEFKQLSNLRNELMSVQKFDMANDLHEIEIGVHSLQVSTCKLLKDLNKDVFRTERRASNNSFLHDHVD